MPSCRCAAGALHLLSEQKPRPVEIAPAIPTIGALLAANGAVSDEIAAGNFIQLMSQAREERVREREEQRETDADHGDGVDERRDDEHLDLQHR